MAFMAGKCVHRRVGRGSVISFSHSRYRLHVLPCIPCAMDGRGVPNRNCGFRKFPDSSRPWSGFVGASHLGRNMGSRHITPRHFAFWKKEQYLLRHPNPSTNRPIRNNQQLRLPFLMKMMRLVSLFFVAFFCGAILSTILTLGAWNVLIEPRVLHCTDSLWPFDEYWTTMETHKGSGDTLAPGWTWEALKVTRATFIIAFLLLWAGITAAFFNRLRRRTTDTQSTAAAKLPS
jgi:hypothetical protein